MPRFVSFLINFASYFFRPPTRLASYSSPFILKAAYSTRVTRLVSDLGAETTRQSRKEFLL